MGYIKLKPRSKLMTTIPYRMTIDGTSQINCESCEPFEEKCNNQEKVNLERHKTNIVSNFCYSY